MVFPHARRFEESSSVTNRRCAPRMWPISRCPVKALLLNQNRVVCGVGNSIADEILYSAAPGDSFL